MSSTPVAGRAPEQPSSAPVTPKPAPPLVSHRQRIPGSFQLLLALYVILTGDFPTIVQGLAIGLEGGAEAEFAAAMVTSVARDLLLLAPIVILASHPLGILHPLLLAVVVWPLLVGMPKVIEQFGGWSGVLVGAPLETPFYVGLPTHDASVVWTATAKYGAIQVLSLASTYLGFWMFKGGRNYRRMPATILNTLAVRTVLIGLFAVSVIALFAFLYFRGGLGEHVTSLGRGRFRELAGAGPVIVIMDLGVVAVYLWIALRPGDAKSPLFLAALAAAVATQFISNGSRGSALMVPIIVALIWALRRQKVPWKMALLLLPLMFLSLGLLSAVRTSSWHGSTAGEAWESAGWGESLEAAQAEIAERRAQSAQVPIVARGFEVSEGPMLGRTYLAALAAWIPRAIWEGKPRGPDSIYSQLFLGEPEEGAGIPVSPAVEMYWNFSWAGVFFLSLLYGMLLRAVYHFFWRRYPDPFATVFYILFVTTFHFSTRELVRFEQQVALLGLCYVAVSMLTPRATASVATPRSRAAAPGPHVLSRQAS